MKIFNFLRPHCFFMFEKNKIGYYKHMKTIKRFLIILFLTIILAYVTNVTSIPDSIVLFKGEKLDLGETFGIYIEENTIEASNYVNDYDKVETVTVSLKLFNLIPIKEVEVNKIPVAKVIPLGNVVGLKLYTEGVLVVGMSDIEGQKPYLNSGIEEGDMIVEINKEKISTTNELIECVNSCGGQTLEIKYIRSGEELETKISPAKTTSNEYKLGLWVRDGAARNWNSNIL